MKIAATLAVALLSASTLAFAANNNGGGRDGAKNDGDRTGSIERNREDFDYEDRERCRKHEFGGPLCGEVGIETHR